MGNLKRKEFIAKNESFSSFACIQNEVEEKNMDREF